MRIFVDFGYEHPLTQRLIPYLGDHSIELTPHPYADCVIHYSHVQYTVNTSMPKVLRLDGCYYDITYGLKTPSNIPLKYSYASSKYVIFQSEYSKRLCENILKVSETPNTIIYNAGDFWRSPEEHDGFNVVCCAKWRRWKRLNEIVQVFKQLPFEATLHVIGPTEPAPIEGNLGGHIIKYYGSMSHEEMKKLYRKMDVALHIAKRDACPNSVVEFISAGIPVIVSDKGGGATELAQMAVNCIVAKGDYDPNEIDKVQQYSDEWNQLPEKFEESLIDSLMKIWASKVKTILPETLMPAYCAMKYADVFRRVYGGG